MNNDLKQYFPEFETMTRVVYATPDLSDLTFEDGFDAEIGIATAEIVSAEFPVSQPEAKRHMLVTLLAAIVGLLS